MESEGLEEGEAEMMGGVEKVMEAEPEAVARGLVGVAEALGAVEAEERGEGEGCSEGEVCGLALGEVTLKLALGEGEGLGEGSLGVADSLLLAFREGAAEAEAEEERLWLKEEELLRAGERETLGEGLALVLGAPEPEGAKDTLAGGEALGAGVPESEKEGEREAAGEREALRVTDTLGVCEGLPLTVPPPGGPGLGLGVGDREKLGLLEAAGLRVSLGEPVGVRVSVEQALAVGAGAETVRLGVAVVAFLSSVPLPLVVRETLAQGEGLREKLPLPLLLRVWEGVLLAAAEAEPLPPGVALEYRLAE